METVPCLGVSAEWLLLLLVSTSLSGLVTAQGPAPASVQCQVVTSWAQGAQTVTQSSCNVVLSSPVQGPRSVKLTCTPAFATASCGGGKNADCAWNVNSDYSSPQPLYQGATWNFGALSTLGAVSCSVASVSPSPLSSSPQPGSAGPPSASQPSTIKAVAVLSGTAGVSGIVNFTQVGDGAAVVVGTISGLTQGLHGFHVHTYGDISGGCESTGAHYNPFGKDHGGPEDMDRHAGDLGNVDAGSDGVAAFTITDSEVSLTGAYSVIGRAVVVHADQDDLGKGNATSKVNGNSGARLACGVIGLAAV